MVKRNKYKPLPRKKWWGNASREVVEVINDLIRSDWCRMFVIKKGHVYLLIKHYRHQQYQNAQLCKIGKSNGEEGYYYETEII